jgi:hypothetical protein
MPNFCPHCAAALDADARFCPSCRAPVGVAGQLASELTGNLKAGFRNVVSEAGQGVPPFIWAAALQTYWLLIGALGMLGGLVATFAGIGFLGAASSLTSGLISAGGHMERFLLLCAISLFGGAVDTCLSTVLVYGFLTGKKWVHGVFMVWLPTKVILSIVTYFVAPSTSKSGEETPFVVLFVGGAFVILSIAALVVEYVLVKRGNAAPDEA